MKETIKLKESIQDRLAEGTPEVAEKNQEARRTREGGTGKGQVGLKKDLTNCKRIQWKVAGLSPHGFQQGQKQLTWSDDIVK